MGGIWVVEVVTPIEAGESPKQPGLVFVVTGTEFRERSFTVRCLNGVEVGAKAGLSLLGNDGIAQSTLMRSDGVAICTEFRLQIGCSWLRGSLNA